MCIGYLEGTDPILLTKLNLRGHGVMPVANHWDTHGKLVTLLKKGEVTAVVGYLHKVLPPFPEDRPNAYDQLFNCQTHSIPVFIIIPAGSEESARQLLGEAAGFVTLVTPETVEEEILKIYG